MSRGLICGPCAPLLGGFRAVLWRYCCSIDVLFLF